MNIINNTKKLMSFKTYKDNLEEFDLIFDYIKNYLSDLVIVEHEFNNHKCLVISNGDYKEFDLAFCCHLDVVSTDNWDIVEDSDNIYGRGSIDMKGALAVCMEVMKNIKSNKRVALFITSDEEIDGYCCSQLLDIYKVGFCIIPDGGYDFNLISEEKGLLQLELSVKTNSSHASQTWAGENAITKLFRVYEELIKIYPLPKDSNDFVTSINLGEIKGGNSFNSVADTCLMKLDIRFTRETNPKKIISLIKKIDKDVKIKKVLESSNYLCDLDNEFVKLYIDSCNKVLGYNVNIKGCESSSDAVYFYDKKIPTVIMNPIGNYPHGKKEFVNKDSLIKLYEIYMKFIKEFKEFF